MLRFVYVYMVAVTCVLGIGSASSAQESFGSFKGEVVAKFLPDGRMMKLEQPFGYVDPKGRSWDVPAGTETDGASVPQMLWTTYPPFTGKYRTAAVVHDYMCGIKQIGWKETHEIFYFAMRAAGVAELVGKAMYGAVYYYGPRWGIGTASRGPGDQLPPEQQEARMNELRAWIARENPSLEEIARRADAGGLFNHIP